MNMGWVRNHAGGTWDLLDARGDVHWSAAAGWVAAGGAATVNAKGARLDRRWPELIPGRPWVHCVLLGGPADGLHQFLDPREHPAGPPAVLETDREQPLPGMPPGPGPDPQVRVTPLRYRLTARPCRDGGPCGCPWPYTWQETG